MRIFTGRSFAVRWIVALDAESFLRGREQISLIGSVRVVAEFAGVFFGGSVRHVARELCDFRIMAVCADFLHGTLERESGLSPHRAVTGGAIAFFKGDMLVMHDESGRIGSVRIMTGGAARADGIESDVTLAELGDVAMTSLTKRGGFLAQHVLVIAAMRIVTFHALSALHRSVDICLC